MKIDNFVRIVDGKLRTLPPIDAFASISFEFSRVSHGDLFIDVYASRENIHQALQRGAYAILTTLPYRDDDEESAWIEVENIERALIKLLRYTLNQKKLHVLSMTCVQAAFLDHIQTPKTAKRLKGDITAIANLIFNAKEDELFYTDNTALCTQIAPTAFEVGKNIHVKIKTVSKGLFLSSFEYQGRYWNDQKIPEHFIEELLNLLHFCDTFTLTYSLEHINFIEHFYPQFISASLSKKEFGSSDRALIFEPNEELLERHLAYLNSRLDKSSHLLCLPASFSTNIQASCFIIRYETYEELKVFLRQKRFSYALILGDKEKFEPFYTTPLTTQCSLF